MSTLSHSADKSLKLTFYSSGNNDTIISVTDTKGINVYEILMSLKRGDNYILIPTDSLEDGVYTVKITNAERSVSIKFYVAH